MRYYNKAAFEGHPENLAGWAKQVTGKLSMAVGGVGINKGMYDRDKASEVVTDFNPLLERFANGEFDLIAVGRAMIGDPHWTNKFRSGETPRTYRQEDDAILS